MNINIYDLPAHDDDIRVIEEMYCKVVNDYRNGVYLPPELIDWMDTANTWLMVECA